NPWPRPACGPRWCRFRLRTWACACHQDGGRGRPPAQHGTVTTMKRIHLLAGLLSFAVVGLAAQQASAWFFGHCCCNKCCTTICCRPYNAFSPCCFGSLCCDGCCPIQTGCGGGHCGGGYGGGYNGGA